MMPWKINSLQKTSLNEAAQRNGHSSRTRSIVLPKLCEDQKPGHTRTGSSRMMIPSRRDWMPRRKYIMPSGRENHRLRQRSTNSKIYVPECWQNSWKWKTMGLDQPPTIDEVNKVISAMTSNRTSGKDSIPAEIFKAGGPNALEVNRDVLQTIGAKISCLKTFAMLSSLLSTRIIKGSKSDCGNNRGILLLSVARSLPAFAWTDWSGSPKEVSRGACVFRPGRSTVDMIFVVRQLQEKCIEQNSALYSVFIDLLKPLIQSTGRPPGRSWRDPATQRSLRGRIRLLHDKMTGQVLCSGDQPAAFTNAVKQFWPQTCLTSSSRAC